MTLSAGIGKSSAFLRRRDGPAFALYPLDAGIQIGEIKLHVAVKRLERGEPARLAQTLQIGLAAAGQQQQLLEQRGELFNADVDPAERRRAIALVMALDTACGRALRSGREYEDDATLLRDAVAVLRRSTPDDHVAVQRYLVRRRHMPDAVRDAGPVIRAFDEFLRKSLEP